MALAEGLALAPWGALGQGLLKTKTQYDELAKSGGIRDIPNNSRDGKPSELAVRASEVLEKIGQNHGGAPPTSIALAWILAKAPYVFPIVGQSALLPRR